MEIIHKLITHLDRKEQAAVIDAVQGETGRTVELSLFENDMPWAVPTDAHLAIRYGNLDRGAVYDTLADGQAACNYAGNIVTFPLPPRLLAVAGLTRVQLAITQEGRTLATFAFHVRVEPDASVGTEDYEDYVNLLPEFIKAAEEGKLAAQQAIAAADVAAGHEAAAGEYARQATNAVHDANYAVQEAALFAQKAQLAAQQAEAATGNGSLTAAQINALDGMFRICACTQNAEDEYAAFRSAFGLGEPDEPDVPVEPDEPDVPSDGWEAVRVLYPEDIKVGKAVFGGDVATRTSYNDLDIPVEAGYTYRVETETKYSVMYHGIVLWDKDVGTPNNSNQAAGKLYDVGWATQTTEPVTVDVVASNSNILDINRNMCMLLAYKYVAERGMEADCIIKVTITRKAVS